MLQYQQREENNWFGNENIDINPLQRFHKFRENLFRHNSWADRQNQ